MTLIERVLCKIFPHVDILRDGTNDLYFRRWFIYPRNKEFKKLEPRLYLHKFYRGDEDPHLHDHPWKFTSLILTRGYWEETRDEDAFPKLGDLMCFTSGADNEGRTQVWYPRFSFLSRPAAWKHRVVLDDEKPVWTIVLTGVKERSWGFWVKDKLCPWRSYHNGVCWCKEGDDSLKKDAA